MYLSQLRKPVDTYLPALGRTYRSMREAAVSRWSRKTQYGFLLAGDARMASAVFETEEAAAFLECLEEREVVVDIGANIGFYSCLASSRGKHVLAFEPSKRNLTYLYRNLWENRYTNVEVFPLGLSSRHGLMQIYGFGGLSSFVRGWGQASQSQFSVVPVTTLDTILGSRFAGARVMVKLDVEGYELEVLRGATALLEATPRPRWMIEIIRRNPVIPGGANPQLLATFDVFWSRGYECRQLEGDRALVSREDVARWEADSASVSGSDNFLFY